MAYRFVPTFIIAVLALCAAAPQSQHVSRALPISSVMTSAPRYAAALPNVFAGARGLSLSAAALDRFIAPSVTGADRQLARKLMAFMPANQRGDFVYLDSTSGRLMSNNPALLKYIKVSFGKPGPVGQRAAVSAHRGTTINQVRGARPMNSYGNCSPANPPPAPHGAYVRDVSPCGFSAGWGFLNVECNTTFFNYPGQEAGYLYMELTGSSGSETEGGLQYNSDTSIAPWLNVNGNIESMSMYNYSTRYGCGQQLAVFAGATTGTQIFYVQVGQVPSYIDPQTEWVNQQQFSLDQASWLFTSAPGDVTGAGTDGAGFYTPCSFCSISKTTTIAQNQIQTYSDDGSYFGVDAADDNTIVWNQLAFGDWASDCYNGTTLCTFDVSADPTVYYSGTQFYPNYPIAQSDVTPTGYGPYQSYDGISLNGSRGQSIARKPLGAFTEPLPPMPCTADAAGNCLVLEQQEPHTSSCLVGYNQRGVPLYMYGNTYIYGVYHNGSPVHFLEKVTRIDGVESTGDEPPTCARSTAWSPGDPRVKYNDQNLP